MPKSESQQIMDIFHNMVDAQKQEQELQAEMKAAAADGIEIPVPMSVFTDIQERRVGE